MSKWDDREADIRRMVVGGLTDEQIGAVWDVTGQTIYNVRLRLGIASNYRRKKKTSREIFDFDRPQPLLPIETYVDSSGQTVTRYPTRYAGGAFVQTITARPRR